jgi:tRNA threonylcarbamoyladenosine modification (KEOPS) complex  Pcc1 subunit
VVVKFFTKKDLPLQNVLNQNKKDFMKTARFIFNFDSEKEARIIADTLNPEIKQKIPKTNVEISLSGSKISLNIESKDLSSLRAACNSYLRWISTAFNVKKTV